MADIDHIDIEMPDDAAGIDHFDIVVPEQPLKAGTIVEEGPITADTPEAQIISLFEVQGIGPPGPQGPPGPAGEGTFSLITNETPNGVIDGINTIFSTN